MAQIKKPAPKKIVAPRIPSKGIKTPMPKIEGVKLGVKKPLPKTIIKTPVKRKVLVMPDKISPSKMTPAQKAKYLKNPERFDG